MEQNVLNEAIKEAVEERVGAEYEIKFQNIAKNNGVVLDSLCIRRKGSKAAPVIYLKRFIDLIEAEERTVEEAAEMIISMYEEYKDCSGIKNEAILDFETIKDKVVYKLVNAEKNSEFLEKVPHVDILDLAIVYYLDLVNAEAGMYTTMVTNRLAEIWKVDEAELHHLAVENTKRLMPASIESLEKVMKRILKEKSLFDEEEAMILDAMGESEIPLYILTNTSGANGAVAMCYEGVLREFANMLNSDLLVLPSSLHEVLLTPYMDDADLKAMADMVASINESEVLDEEVLSDHVYKYTRSGNLLTIVS